MKPARKIGHTIMQSAVIALTMLFAAVGARAQQFSFTAIDVPGAKFTSARGINSAGNIVGTFIDGNGKVRGFLLTGFGGSNATFSAIDFPPSQSPTGTVRQTGARGTNDTGDIVGQYTSADGKTHGFLAVPSAP